MSTKDNVHSGHRERIIGKFLDNPNAFLDHELLEILLFYALPRKDTNALAHRIIRRFGSLDKVFNSSKDELKSVEGVGDKIANLIILVGQIHKNLQNSKDVKKRLDTFEKVKNEIKEFFECLEYETFLVMLLNKNYAKIASLEFSDDKKYEVSTDIPEFSRAIAVHKPKYAIIAHNHSSKIASPSAADDLSTKKINLLCELHDVVFLDHIIYASNGETFSYHQSRRMEYIKNQADINKLLEKLKETENE